MTTDLTQVPLAKIDYDERLQMRAAGLIESHVVELCEALDEGEELEPVHLFKEGSTYWPGDGFHRGEAHKRKGRKYIYAHVQRGTFRDALLFAIGGNNKPAMGRTREDKRRAVLALLSDKEWAKWSNVEIAKRCAVSKFLVQIVKSEQERAAHPELIQDRTVTVERNGTTYSMTKPAPRKHIHDMDAAEQLAAVQAVELEEGMAEVEEALETCSGVARRIGPEPVKERVRKWLVDA